MLTKFSLLLYFVIIIHQVCDSSPTQDEEYVKTVNGVLKGKHMTSRNGREFLAFVGVPFAEPPVGKLRFSHPVSPMPWSGVRNATEEADVCIQKFKKGFIGSEDCLYLNIFTHSTNTSKSSPVMVFIHGGGYYIGSASTQLLGPEYFMDKDVVLVVIQYRLGPFGFLSTEDQFIPGNWGLHDQVKALELVKENIKLFGGNPNQITIFGCSVGGSSVDYLMKSPRSKGLFNKAISESGTAFSPFAIMGKGKAKKDTQKLATSLNCSTDTSTEILLCLQNKSSSEIMIEFLVMLKTNIDTVANKIFRPVLEAESNKSFITQVTLQDTRSEIPWLIGLNANEGIFKIQTKHLIKTIDLVKNDFFNVSLNLMSINDLYINLNEITNLTHSFYFGNASTTENFIKSIEEIVTDSWFAWPTLQAIQKHRGVLYCYLYDHNAQYTYANVYGCPTCKGVSHLDELFVLFNNKMIPELNQDDTNISKLMIDLWVNFATEGNPTPNPIMIENSGKEKIFWNASNNSDPSFLHIQTKHLSMQQGIFPQRMVFWQHSLPLIPVD